MIKQVIHPTRFHRNKARSVISYCKALVDEYGGRVAQAMEAVIRLPSVWRQANIIVLGNVFGLNDGIAEDTHVRRVADRLELVQSDKQDEIEQQLCRVIPREKWTLITDLLNFHRQITCKPQRPACPHCLVCHLCPWPHKIP